MSDSTAFVGTVDNLVFAAEDGHVESMFLLGVAYAQGHGIERDHTSAARWFQLAAKKGHVRARTSLGFLYSIGRGVRHDQILAYVLLDQAANDGDPLASDLLIRLRRQMNPAQISDAERRVKNRQVG